jgi:hypothetical protein
MTPRRRLAPRPRRPLHTPPLVATAVLLILAAGCSERDGMRPRNHPPEVRLTGGPANGDSADYNAIFYWHGWDTDGIVAGYRYALANLVDHPEVLTPADLPAAAWHDTLVTHASFELRSPDAIDGDEDESMQGSTGRHLFAVQAVDDQGDSSDVDWLVVTSRNVVPVTTIESPTVPAEAGLVQFREGVEIRWTGLDPDSPEPARQPAAYEWKVVPLPPGTPAFAVNVHHVVATTPGPEYPWIRVDGSVNFLRLNLQSGIDYVFAVRAIDFVGGVEDVFVKGRNAIPFTVSSIDLFRPYLTLRDPQIGQFTFPSDGGVWEFEAPLSRCLQFELTGDASSYAGAVNGYDWCIDPQNGGEPGECRGWTGFRTTDPICFDTPGLHTLIFKARDTAGAVTTGVVYVRVIPVVRDRPVLLVDDFRVSKRGEVLDADGDERMRAMLMAAGYAPDDIYEWSMWGDMDREINPIMPRLSELTTYKLLVWSVSGNGFNANPGLALGSACPGSRVIRSFLDDGGAMWITGQYAFGAMLGRQLASRGCGADLSYSESEGIFSGADDFACRYLRLCGAEIRTVRDRYRTDGLVGATPTPDARLEGFPDVSVDSTLSHPNIAGLVGSDALFQPVFDGTGGLDTLYTAVPATPTSRFARRPMAFRYFDPAPGAKRGAVAVMAFPPHYMKPGTAAARSGVAGMAIAMIDWFRRHERAVANQAGRPR